MPPDTVSRTAWDYVSSQELTPAWQSLSWDGTNKFYWTSADPVWIYLLFYSVQFLHTCATQVTNFFFSISWKFESTIRRLCHFFHLYYARRNHWKYLYAIMKSLPFPLLSCSSLHFSSLNYPSQNLLDQLSMKQPRSLTRVSQDLFIEPMLYFIAQLTNTNKILFPSISRKWMNFSTLWKMSFPVSEGIVAMKLCFEWLYFITTFFINQDLKLCHCI